MVTSDGSTLSLYVDGVLVNTTAGQFSTIPNPTLSIFDGAVGYVAYGASVLTPTRVLAHYNAGANAFFGEQTAGTTPYTGPGTGSRITRLLSYRPNTGMVLDTGLGYMGEQDIKANRCNKPCSTALRSKAASCFIDGQGRVNFRSRSRLFNPTPNVTLDFSQGAVSFGSNFREDTQNVLNDVTVTRNGGADNRFVNAASVNGPDGEYSNQVTLDIDTDANAMNMAGWMVAQGVAEQISATPLQVNLLQLAETNLPLVAQILQLRPFDVVQLVNCTWQGAPASTMTFMVQGGQWTLAADAASVSLTTTPLPPVVGTWDSTLWDSTAAVWAP